MNITGKVEFIKTPQYINSPIGRYEEWLKRDDNIYCKFHSKIHPDNVESIRLKEGSVTKTVKKNIEVEHFRYCPRCFIISSV